MIDKSKPYEYFAFISYKREDEKWAKWLQKKLESYSLPTAIRKENPELPNKIRPVFRDQSELAGGNLKTEIEKGLDGSKYLIVICSPRSAKSPWVSKEVQHFIDQGREEYIIPFIIGGTPNASNSEEECFPEGLRQLTGEKEILGININEMGRDAAAIKVIARMFDLRFDSLWRRFEKEKRQKRMLTGMCAIALVALSLGVAGYIARQNLLLSNANKTIIAERDRANNEWNRAEAYNEKLSVAFDSISYQAKTIQRVNEDLIASNITLKKQKEETLRALEEMKQSRDRYLSSQLINMADEGNLILAMNIITDSYDKTDYHATNYVPEWENAIRYVDSKCDFFVDFEGYNKISPFTQIHSMTFNETVYHINEINPAKILISTTYHIYEVTLPKGQITNDISGEFMAYSKKYNLIAYWDNNNICIYDNKIRNVVSKIEIPSGARDFTAIAFVPNTKQVLILCCGCFNGFDLEKDYYKFDYNQHKPIEELQTYIDVFEFSPDGNRFIVSPHFFLGRPSYMIDDKFTKIDKTLYGAAFYNNELIVCDSTSNGYYFYSNNRPLIKQEYFNNNGSNLFTSFCQTDSLMVVNSNNRTFIYDKKYKFLEQIITSLKDRNISLITSDNKNVVVGNENCVQFWVKKHRHKSVCYMNSSECDFSYNHSNGRILILNKAGLELYDAVTKMNIWSNPEFRYRKSLSSDKNACVDYSRDGSIAVLSHPNLGIYSIDTNTGLILDFIDNEATAENIESLRISPDNNTVALLSNDSIMFVNLKTKNGFKSLENKNYKNNIQFYDNDNLICSTRRDIIKFNIRTGKSNVVHTCLSDINYFYLSPDNKNIVLCYGNTIVLLDGNSKAIIKNYTIGNGKIRSIAVNDKASKICYTTTGNELGVLDVKSGMTIFDYKTNFTTDVIAFGPQDKGLILDEVYIGYLPFNDINSILRGWRETYKLDHLDNIKRKRFLFE